ncbi:MAG: TIGR00730 family Rossman fold protein [Polyangiales bacterium]
MRICVFCGSSPGLSPHYREAASALGTLLAAEGIGLVYGGASRGLMGELANAALAHGGEVIGVIPHAIVALEVAHRGLADLRVVGTMHERKALMADLSDAFIAMPGGNGTLDELFEIYTWQSLGIHDKPIGLWNVAGFFDPLLAMQDHMVAEGFVSASIRARLIVERSAEALVSRLGEVGASRR